MKNILLASHGTEGALAAENKVLEMCAPGVRVTHLLVIPEFWKDMLGDDWLNNSSTRKRFEHYLEMELSRETNGHLRRVRDRLSKTSADSAHEVVLGKPDQCLTDACEQSAYDLVVMGSPRPKRSRGLRSQMMTRHVTRRLKTPLLVVPHPCG
ncbi:MAG: hypothetical protein F4Y53_05245 [Proteobacteria bacterium]|nr:hypothetical protein [Pseudomonadota bacterium]